ncbi:MAG: regulatory iron-sulfur-containing complex subunit RicT [Thermodesulfobacteriota bacterium]|nr:regulatory iron-sulfur-containing complex subunit RicT [Thermodesulfobacteriota bacterium]
MGKIVGIRFSPAGKIYDFDAGAFVLNQNDHVIVETQQGLGYGVVAVGPIERENEKNRHPLKKVYRLATLKDKDQLNRNLATEKSAHAYCQQCIDKLGLKMNLFSVETTFDARKTTFFFTAEGRVDFRQLVKMLVKKLTVRVEMRQVGIRNQAKMIGGLGRCGREICCSTFIQKFEPISIRMAKNQGLSLNPTKISGLCGRLMCCLTFENTAYRNHRKKPKPSTDRPTVSGKSKMKISKKIPDNAKQ